MSRKVVYENEEFNFLQHALNIENGLEDLRYDKVVIATVLGMSRYLIFTVPCIIVMSSFLGITGVWWAQPVADVLCFAFTMVFAVRELRRLGSMKAENGPQDVVEEGAFA